MENIERKSNYSHIMKYTSIFGGIQVLNILIGIVRNKFVAMILGPGGMGLLSLFNSTVKLVSESTNLGLPISGVKTLSQVVDSDNTEEIENTVSTIRLWSLITALLGFLVCSVFGNWFDRLSFNWGDHTLHFVLLAPVVSLMAITGGETAILKAARRLGNLATISFYNVLALLVVSIPIYYFAGESGIVPSLLVFAFVQLLITVSYSFRVFPYKVRFCRSFVAGGMSMIRLGVAFVIAGIMGSGADFVIRSYLTSNANLYIVGLYNAGYMMTFVYAGMVFSSLDSDYFPRLSATADNKDEQNRCVNRQIEVMILLVSPFLVAFVIFMPVLLPLLYSGKFLPVLGMMQVAALAMFVRAVSLPVEYLPLAKGNSWLYLFVESVYDMLVVILTIFMYRILGLFGAGAALVVAMLADYALVYIIMKRKYGYTMSNEVVCYISIFFPIVAMSYIVTFIESAVVYWSLGILLAVAASAISVTILHNKTNLWKRLMGKLHR